MEIAGADTTFSVDLFNVLGANTVTGYDENAESGVDESNDDFMLPTNYQTPRYVRFSASIRF